jgi:hypothetical protein
MGIRIGAGQMGDKSNIVGFAPRNSLAGSGDSEPNRSDAYTDFILKHGHMPDRSQAAAIGKLLGKRVRAADGSLQPPKSKSEKAAAKKTRRIDQDEETIDANLNRAIDAIALLAQNEGDPIALIHRMSPMEQDEISENIEKAVKWLIRFSNDWRSYVQNGIVQAQNAAPADDGQAWARRLYLVTNGDLGS